jgi:hypothetical protein
MKSRLVGQSRGGVVRFSDPLSFGGQQYSSPKAAARCLRGEARADAGARQGELLDRAKSLVDVVETEGEESASVGRILA